MEAIRKKLTVLRGEVDEAKDRAEKAENEKREAREEADKVRVCIYIVYMRTTVAVYMHALSSFRKPRSCTLQPRCIWHAGGSTTAMF